MTHDYKRHGTTTLFAALNVLEGKVIGRCMQRHRHQEFIRFLNTIEAEVPAGKLIHVIVDNYATHKHPKVRAWLDRHPRLAFHFTPTSASWLNAVEGFFAKLTKRRLKRGVFRSIVDLQAAINRFLAEANDEPKALRLDRRSRQNHRRRQTRAPSVRFDPLASAVGGFAIGVVCVVATYNAFPDTVVAGAGQEPSALSNLEHAPIFAQAVAAKPAVPLETSNCGGRLRVPAGEATLPSIGLHSRSCN